MLFKQGVDKLLFVAPEETPDFSFSEEDLKYDARIIVSHSNITNSTPNTFCLQIPFFISARQIIEDYVNQNKDDIREAVLWPNTNLLVKRNVFFVCICLEKRKNNVLKLCEHFSIDCKYIAPEEGEKKLTCTQSHEAALELFLKSNKERCVVFEDDITMCHDII